MQPTWWQVDLTQRDAVEGAVNAIRPDYVFHLASRVTGGRDAEMVIPLFEEECAASVFLLEALGRVGCRRVVCSGSAEEPDGRLQNATIASPYAAAKTASRVYQMLFDQLYDLPIVNARIAMVYGPGQHDRSKLVPYVTRSLLSGVRPRVTAGFRRVDWIYIDDVVDALLLLTTTESVRGQAVDVGSGTLASIKEVIQRIQRITGSTTQPLFGALPPRPLDQVLAGDIDRTQRLLGWRAKVGLDEGLRRTVRACRKTLGRTSGAGFEDTSGGKIPRNRVVAETDDCAED